MISTIAALLVVAPSTPEGQWGPTSMTAPALAARVDTALATLQGVTLKFIYEYSTSIAYAFKDCSGTFVSPTKFRVELPHIDPKRQPAVDYETWVADGSRFGSALSSHFPQPQLPLSRRPLGPSHPAAVWFADCANVMLSGAGRPTHPLASFVKDAKAQGFALSVQERRLTYRGRLGTWYRLVALKGPARYETVFDATGYLPVNVINTQGPKDQVRWNKVQWSKPRSIDLSAARFSQPKSVQGSSPAPRPR